MTTTTLVVSFVDQFTDDEAPNHDLVCIGVVGIQDPLRPGVIEAVAAFRHAGVFVRMVCLI